MFDQPSHTEQEFTAVCAWCRSHLGGAPPGTAPVTHGICQPCADRMLAEAAIDPACHLTITVKDPDGGPGPAADADHYDLGGEG